MVIHLVCLLVFARGKSLWKSSKNSLEEKGFALGTRPHPVTCLSAKKGKDGRFGRFCAKVRVEWPARKNTVAMGLRPIPLHATQTWFATKDLRELVY